MLAAFQIATILLVIMTILPLWRNPVWWVRGWDFPRLQLFVMALLLLFGSLFLLETGHGATRRIIAACTICLLYHGWWIFPYTKIFPVEVKAAKNIDRRQTLRIMTANVLTPNRQADKLLQLVRANDPDILVTLESDKWWQEQLDVLEAEYAYTIKCPLDNLYGMHVYSRLSLSDSRISYLVENDVPSMHTVISLASGRQVRAHFLHPGPPSPTENEESSERDAELIIVARSVAESVAENDTPIIVTGDLNDVAWSETTRLFRKISGLLDPRVGRGMFNTFHAAYWFMRWPLDHLFHSDHFTLVDIRRLPYFGSDHFALFAELAIDSQSAGDQNGLEADAADHKLARQKMQEKKVNKHMVPRPGGI